MALLLAFGFSLVLAFVISVAMGKKDGRSFSVPVFVVACIILYVIAAPIARKWQADWQLQHTPLYQQIAQYDPATFQLIRQEVLKGVENRRSSAETSGRIAGILGRALPRRIPQASDDSVLSYASEMAHFLRQMSQTNPNACFYLLHPGNSESHTAVVGPEAEKSEEQLLMAMAQMLESANSHPQPSPDPQESQNLVQEMFSSLRLKYGKDAGLLRGGAVTDGERKKVCEMSADFFQEATEMPEKHGSMALRYLLSQAESRHDAP